MEKVKILNIEINNIKKRTLLKTLEKGVIYTPNVDHLIKLQYDKEFYIAYEQADYKVCDSRVLLLSSRIGLLPPIKEQIPGSDLFPEFCIFHKSNHKIKIFLLGGNTYESLQLAIERINHKVGREIIVGGYSPPFGFDKSNQEIENIIRYIKETEANVLAVGLGAPKQEKWIAKNKPYLPKIDIFIGIGATIEFEAGTLKRAPKLLTKIGLEWAYRIYKEPARLWRRYLYNDLPIFYLVIMQKLGYYQNPWENPSMILSERRLLKPINLNRKLTLRE